MLEAQLAHFGDELFGGDTGAFAPAGHGNLAVLGVDARGKHVGVLRQRFLGEFGVGYQRGSQHHARNARGRKAVDGFQVADAAAHLDLQAGFLDNALDGVDVLGHTAAGTVQVDHVDPGSALFLELGRLGNRVVVVHGNGVVVALGQADRFAAQDVDSRKNIHDVPFTWQAGAGCPRGLWGTAPWPWARTTCRPLLLSGSSPAPSRRHRTIFRGGTARRTRCPSALRRGT